MVWGYQKHKPPKKEEVKSAEPKKLRTRERRKITKAKTLAEQSTDDDSEEELIVDRKALANDLMEPAEFIPKLPEDLDHLSDDEY